MREVQGCTSLITCGDFENARLFLQKTRYKQPFFEKFLIILRNKQPFLEKFLISLRNKQAFSKSPHVVSEVPLHPHSAAFSELASNFLLCRLLVQEYLAHKKVQLP